VPCLADDAAAERQQLDLDLANFGFGARVQLRLLQVLLHAARWISMRRTELQRKLDVYALADADAQCARQSAYVSQGEADGSVHDAPHG
jgi:hypothetical protein